MEITNEARKHNSPKLQELLDQITPLEMEQTKNKMQLAARIEHYMRARGWSNSQFAKKLGKKTPEIRKWLSGTHAFTVDLLMEIAAVFGVEITALFEKSPQLSFSDMQLVSHSLGIDLFKAVMSLKLKDKKLPKTFYRNYYNASKRQAEIAGIDNLIEHGYMACGKPEYYYVTEIGIEQFSRQFSEMAVYVKKKDVDIENLKHRINFYCSFYNYNFGGESAAHVIQAYQTYWVNKQRVSHTTADAIKRFKTELKRLL